MYENTEPYPEGASRFCECIEARVSGEPEDSPLFLVMDMCGTPLSAASTPASEKAGIDRARKLTGQLVQGLAFMQMFTPPVIHHDLKPDNVLIDASGSVKIIDFGSFVPGHPANEKKPAPWTPAYKPPEVPDFEGFRQPPYSYDVYSVGLIYWGLLCPRIKLEDLGFPFQPAQVTKKCPGVTDQPQGIDIAPDLEHIRNMIATDPQRRPAPEDMLKWFGLRGPLRLMPDPALTDPLATETEAQVSRRLSISRFDIKDSKAVEVDVSGWKAPDVTLPWRFGKLSIKCGRPGAEPPTLTQELPTPELFRDNIASYRTSMLGIQAGWICDASVLAQMNGKVLVRSEVKRASFAPMNGNVVRGKVVQSNHRVP